MKQNHPVLAIAVGLAVAGTAAVSSPAEACDPEPTFWMEEVDNDTPECVHFRIVRASTDSIQVEARSDCDEEFVLTAVECESCQPEVTVAAAFDEAVTEKFYLEGFGDTEVVTGRTYQQYYEWEMGEADGVLTMEASYTGSSEEDPCPDMHSSCSTGGERSSTQAALVVLMVLLAVGTGRIRSAKCRREKNPITAR